MSQEFVTFQRFDDKAAAQELADIFKENNIEVLLEDESANFDVTFANNEFDKDFRVKLKPEDFEQAKLLLLKRAEQDLEHIDPDHYLFNFSDEELKDVVEKEDEWSSLDFLLAKKLLKERGVVLSADEIESFKAKRIEVLSEPEKSPRGLILAGYILIFIGGLFAVVIGLYLRNHKKTLPNGERTFGYTQSDRVHGERILILGILGIIVSVVIQFRNYI